MRKPLALFSVGCVAVGLLWGIAMHSPEPSESHSPTADTQEIVSSSPNIQYGFNLDSLALVRNILKANENLGAILSRYKVSGATIARIAQLPSELFDVRRLRANTPYSLIHSKDSVALGFVYHASPREYIVLNLSDTVSVTKGKNKIDTVTHTLTGIIATSLYESVLEHGGDAALVNELFDIFAWDIDFWAIPEGDTYKVLYTTYEVEGEPAGFGHIQSAVINHLGEPYYAFSYDLGEGNGREYFDAMGESRKGAFLRVPLQYTRISSRFSHSRFHPVLKRRRPHYGVDFAAPTGTPVYAIGDGTIRSAGYNGGAGNMIKVQHGEGFMSGYLHLSGFAKGIRKGVHVSQGQTIGYVGSTGLSTGPHLDFRLWKNGIPLTPLRLSTPVSDGVCDALREDFEQVKDRYMSILEGLAIPELSEEDYVVQLPEATAPES